EWSRETSVAERHCQTWGWTSIHSLRIAREHFDDVVVEAIVKLLLECPGKLGVFDFAGAEQESVIMELGVFRLVTDFDFDAFFGGAGGEIEQWMLVADQFR